MATIKTEPGVKVDPGIKPDPEDVKGSPAAFEDDDLYEDAGDLEFYETINPQEPADNAFLTHIPTYLHEQWAHLNGDDELVIGKIRTWTDVDKSGQQIQKLAMLIDSNNPIHQSVPKEYNLELKDPNLLNTFIFTEQDLPGFKNKSQGGPNNNIPFHLRPKLNQPKENGKPEQPRRGRREPYYRKAIPKKTRLAARFRQELNCQPVMTAETKHILQMRASDALKPKATTSVMAGTRNPVGVIHAGTTVGNDKMRGFVRTVDPKAKAKKQKEERAARMDRHDLRDIIFKCYDEYRYWTMRAFKNRLNQPEAWLRENLEELAVLHKTGRFANNWELKPEYRKGPVMANEEAAPALGPGDDDDSAGDDDDNIQMEDVM